MGREIHIWCLYKTLLYFSKVLFLYGLVMRFFYYCIFVYAQKSDFMCGLRLVGYVLHMRLVLDRLE